MTALRACLIMALLLLAARSAAAECADERPEDKAAIFPFPKNAAQIGKAEYLHASVVRKQARNTILIWGEICAGDAERVRAVLESYKPIEEVLLISPGGSLADGLGIGRIIHNNRITTHVRAGEECFSACNFMFMGGTVRIIDAGGKFGVHMFATVGDDAEIVRIMRNATRYADEYNAAHPDAKIAVESAITVALQKYLKDMQQDAAQVSSQIARFLVDMQLSLRFLTAFANIPNESPRYLTRDELRDFNIVNAE